MVVLWAGYTFSKDYSTPRGHMYALNDAIHSLRTGAPMKAADGPNPLRAGHAKSRMSPDCANDRCRFFLPSKMGGIG